MSYPGADSELFLITINQFNLWAVPENIHTSPMDDIGNPVRMFSEYDWKSTNSPKFCKFLTGIPGNPFKFLRNFGIPQDFGPAGYGILQKLQLSFLEILKFLGTQFSVVHGDGVGGGGVLVCVCVCVWIFSGIAQHNRIIFFLKLSCLETQNETRIQLQF